MSGGIEYTFCQLREREVVNIADGKRLGRIIDMGFNCQGKILGIILPANRKFFKNITNNDNIFVPWRQVLKIGDDVILVELPPCGPNNGNGGFQGPGFPAGQD